MSIAWKRNEINGEANFDIDDDELKDQGLLFDSPPLKKIEAFQKRVKEKVLAGEITNNIQAFNYALEEGHLGKHAADILKKMKNEEITFEGTSPLVTYDQVYKMKRKLEYRIITK